MSSGANLALNKSPVAVLFGSFLYCKKGLCHGCAGFGVK
jgi:hypothetical protein